MADESFPEQIKPVAVFFAYDKEHVDLYSHALGYSCVVYEMKDKLRSLEKWDTKVNSSDEMYKLVSDLKDFLYESCNENHLPE